MPTAFNASLYSVLRALHVPDHDAYDAATHQVAEVPQRDPARVLAACRSEVASVFACLGQSCVAGWR